MKQVFAITIAIIWLMGQGALADILKLSETGEKTPNQPHVNAGANCDLKMTADPALFLWSLRQP